LQDADCFQLRDDHLYLTLRQARGGDQIRRW
jgi:hypothetical protein